MLAFLLPLILAVVYGKWFHPCIWKPVDYLLLTLEAKECSGLSFNNTFNLQVWEPLLETSLSYSSQRLIDKRMKFQQFWADWRLYMCRCNTIRGFPGTFLGGLYWDPHTLGDYHLFQQMHITLNCPEPLRKVTASLCCLHLLGA